MKNLFIVALLLIGFQSFAQDPYFQQSNPEMKKKAIAITNEYNRELALSGEQEVLFQSKIEEYLIKREKIEEEFKGKEKLNFLHDMQEQETADMNDILTRPQMEFYKKVKPEIQPLEVVAKD
ncbi:hypothetical protein EI546_03990 [Aequorivita sp. H23M31]|uniref:OmpH family outer membrane protein n=1 Tax=Aequorivita ciconiae TaxID=2494375 RepID=A0A410G116_9FLAO|nr:hypothetical protein [Aequorivita sp. H23M31]QAA80941.1 hypothetical protein EI546_03990 [Aequorivita sp. H23M31]